VRALLACLVLAALLAGCGKATEVREPDLVISGSSATPARPADSGPSRQRRPRIAVVTHGQASSAFWVIVRNGINAAARETNAIVSYRSPDVYSVDRMRRLINDAVDRHPDGLVVSIPSPELGGAIRRAVNMGIPVVSIN
jgi:simple sugar transport system substrate-binding protein